MSFVEIMEMSTINVSNGKTFATYNRTLHINAQQMLQTEYILEIRVRSIMTPRIPFEFGMWIDCGTIFTMHARRMQIYCELIVAY